MNAARLPDPSTTPRKRQLRHPAAVTKVDIEAAATLRARQLKVTDSLRWPTKQQTPEYELFVAHPIRQLTNGWILRIRHRECAIESRNFAVWKFVGRCGERWIVILEKRLVRRFGLTGGVPILEMPEAVGENKAAEQLELPLKAPM